MRLRPAQTKQQPLRAAGAQEKQMKDWKTTAAGVLTILVGFITFIAVPYLHGQAPNIAGFTATLAPGITGILASDTAKAK